MHGTSRFVGLISFALLNATMHGHLDVRILVITRRYHIGLSMAAPPSHTLPMK